MADVIELRESVSLSVTIRDQETKENPSPAPTPGIFTRLDLPELGRRFQTFVNGPWMDLISKMVILIVSVSQSCLNPCEEEPLSLTVAGIFVYLFFIIEMVTKMSVQGVYRSEGGYLRNNWNKLDALILFAETLEYILHMAGVHWGICQALRPLRLVSRDKHLRNLINTILKIFPMVMNILVLFVCVVFVFGILGVQLWGGDLRNRCVLGKEVPSNYSMSLSPYFMSDIDEKDPFICSAYTYGSQHCSDVPPFRDNGQVCLLDPPGLYWNVTPQTPAWMNYSDCINWNKLYNMCRPAGPNLYMGSINFDNIGYAWITIFQVVTLEGWTDIMYYVMDASSYWSFLFFILVTGFGSFIILNTCTVIIATHFSESLDEHRDEEDESFVLIKNCGCMVIGCLKQFWSRNIRNREQTESSQSGQTKRGPFFRLRRKLRDFVKGQFTWVMMITIILNVITMAVEHHNQPEMLTQALYVCNIIFTVLFVVELVLNLIVSQLSYFLVWENLFDFVIVIISLIELGSKGGRMVSVFRVFRVVRFVKLLHFLPYLRRQLLVLKRTITESASLCWLVLFFIYIFSILGMTLFSCQFLPENGNLIDDRKNFDSLLWAMVTVFQVLTQEDWNFVLYNAMVSTSPFAALYFVVIIVLGKNILLNILVGIVVESFQAQPTEGESGDEAADPPANSDILTAPENGPETNLENTQVSSPQDDAEPTHSTLHNRFLRLIQPVLRWYKEHENWSLFLLPPENNFRRICQNIVSHRFFDYVIMGFIVMSCVTIAFERPAIHPESVERLVLDIFSHMFTVVFTVEMVMKVIASGLVFGKGTYVRCPWNVIDGTLAIGSLTNIVIILLYSSHTSTLRILKVFRLLRVFRPLRMVKRTPKLKLAVETLIASVKPMANIVLISSLFFLVFAILGVQLFKGKFYHCVGEDLSNIKTKMDCLAAGYQWVLKEYNFDNLFQALVSLFVCYSKDGWISLMYDGLDGVGVDLQPVKHNNLWMLIYFLFFVMISVLLLDMFIGVMVDTFHQCQQRQGREEAVLPQAPPENSENEAADYESYSARRRFIFLLCKSKTLEFIMTIIIFLNMILMGAEHYNQPGYITGFIEFFFLIFTIILLIEIAVKIIAVGLLRFCKDGWNVLDIFVFASSIVSIVLTQIQMPNAIPFNPSILRICRALRLTQVLKAKTIKTLLKTIVKTLTQVGNISLLLSFFLFIYAALGVELFGTLECSVENPCVGLHRYSNFHDFLLALLTLYKVCTGDNWSGVLKDTLRPCIPGDSSCSNDNFWIAPIYFFTFVILAQFFIMNLVVASITQALEESRQEVHRVQLPQDDAENPPEANSFEAYSSNYDSPEEDSSEEPPPY